MEEEMIDLQEGDDEGRRSNNPMRDSNRERQGGRATLRRERSWLGSSPASRLSLTLAACDRTGAPKGPAWTAPIACPAAQPASWPFTGFFAAPFGVASFVVSCTFASDVVRPFVSSASLHRLLFNVILFHSFFLGMEMVALLILVLLIYERSGLSN